MSMVIPTSDALQPALPQVRARRLSGLDDAFLSRLGAAPTAFETRRFLTELSASTGAELVLVGVEDASGAPLAMFPFTLRRAGGLRRLEGLGFGLADYYLPWSTARSFSDGEARQIWRAVVAALPKADTLVLTNVPRQLYGRSQVLSDAGFLRPMGHGATVLQLRDAAGAVLVRPDEMSAARDVRRKLRKLAAEGEVTLQLAETQAETDELLEAMVRFRAARFAELGRGDKLDEPGIEQFYRRLATDGKGLVRLYGLRVGGEIVAIVYGFSHRGVFTLIIPTMTAEARWQAGSPGLVALFMAIEHCIAAGDRVFDFSVGALHYKTRFGAEKVELFEHRQALSGLGLLPVWRDQARTALRTYLLTRPELGQKLRGALARLRHRVSPSRTHRAEP